jgi:hypothetical protein
MTATYRHYYRYLPPCDPLPSPVGQQKVDTGWPLSARQIDVKGALRSGP